MSETLAPASTKNALVTLSSIFAAAVADGLVSASPCAKVSVPRVPKRRMTLPSPEEVYALSDALPEHLRVAVMLGAGAGLRIGEALGLAVDDVSFLKRELTVTHQLSPEGALCSPKSLESVRTVPLGDVVLEALSAHVAAFPSENGLLITTTTGCSVMRNGWGHQWRRACERAGVDFRYHDLRHFYASCLIDGGYSVVAIQKVLGHASARITLDVYGHLWPDPNDVPRTALDAVLSRANVSLCPSGVPEDAPIRKAAGQEG
jgi:integrase